MKNKRTFNKGFILPSTIITMVLISVLTLLIMTFLTSTSVTNKSLSAFSRNKLQSEKIFFDFKNNIQSEYGDEISIKTYSADNDISAIIVSKNEKTICFGIYDFLNEKTICFQTTNFDIDWDENGNLVYDTIIFSLDVASS